MFMYRFGMPRPSIFRGIDFDTEGRKFDDMLTDIEDLVIQEISGLCQSCKHATNCMYRKHATKAVLQCEVFEGQGEAMDLSAPGMVPEKGLCLNCDKSTFCQLHKKASGVWHCEEYE